MGPEYICSNCKQPVDNGALFCGNCGVEVMLQQESAEHQIPVNIIKTQEPVAAAAAIPVASPIAQVYQNPPEPQQIPQQNYPAQMMAAAPSATNVVPNYAVAYPHPHQHFAAIALALGIIGMFGGIIVPAIGIVLGVVGIIFSTTSYRGSSKGLKISSLIICILAVLVGIAFWINAISHDPALHPQQAQKVSQAGFSNGTASLSVTTPCYTVGFNSQLNVNNTKGSCAMNAYNGTAITSSSNIYKVLSNSVPDLSQANFSSVTKQALEADVKQNLPGFTITNEKDTTFSGNPAYIVQANDPGQDVAVVEEGVLHSSSSNSNNFFVLVHIDNGITTDVSGLEKNWTWND